MSSQILLIYVTSSSENFLVKAKKNEEKKGKEKT